MSKRDFGSIKSLLHFDYPYFNEPNDGLDDEVGLETWTKNGTVSLYGNEAPKAGTLVPKFGYRCLRTYEGSVQSNNNSGIWNLNSSGNYEIEMFVQVAQIANAQNIFTLMDTAKTTEILKLSLLVGGTMNFVSSGFGVESVSGITVFTVNVWHHIVFRISDGYFYIYLDGCLEISSELSSDIVLSVGQVRVGNNVSSYNLFIDEFIFRHSSGKGLPNIPSVPYNGGLDISKVGGYGTGADGDTTFSSSGGLGKSAVIYSVSGSSITVSAWSSMGIYSPEVEREVMIHVTAPRNTTLADYPAVGLYAFRKIASVDGDTLELDEAISLENGDDFTLDSSLLTTYYVQVIIVPNFRSFTINAGVTITPQSWSTSSGGGIIAFRCYGDCTVNGSIITHNKGTPRYDLQQITHSKLIDRFLCSKGGGIFIACGGTFSAPSTARLGASWSGLGDETNGAAGYGGKGGGAKPSSSVSRSGGAGGVGGGGGGATSYESSGSGTSGGAAGGTGGSASSGGGGGGCGGKGGNGSLYAGGSGGGGQAGSGGISGTGRTPGSGATLTNRKSNGVNGGSSGEFRDNNSGYSTFSGAGGGAPGGNGGNGSSFKTPSASTRTISGGCAGASIILVCKKLNADEAAISTGGAAGTTRAYESGYYRIGGAGGGGTGFCYIAAGVLLNE